MFTKFVTTFITSISKLVFKQTPEKKICIIKDFRFFKSVGIQAKKYQN